MVKKANNIKLIVESFVSELRTLHIHCENVLLFGSHARQEEKEGSDIDLIVISSDWKKYSMRERLEILGVAAARILKPVQAVGFTPEEIKKQTIIPFWLEVIKYAKKAA